MGGLDSAEEADAFFASFPEDPALAPSVERLKPFLQRVGVDTPIALVTSGGTTAPLVPVVVIAAAALLPPAVLLPPVLVLLNAVLLPRRDEWSADD